MIKTTLNDVGSLLKNFKGSSHPCIPFRWVYMEHCFKNKLQKLKYQTTYWKKAQKTRANFCLKILFFRNFYSICTCLFHCMAMIWYILLCPSQMYCYMVCIYGHTNVRSFFADFRTYSILSWQYFSTCYEIYNIQHDNNWLCVSTVTPDIIEIVRLWLKRDINIF